MIEINPKVEKVLGILQEIRNDKYREGQILLKQHDELFHDICSMEFAGQRGIMSIEKLDNIMMSSHKAILNKLDYIDNIMESVKDANDIVYSIICLSSVLQA